MTQTKVWGWCAWHKDRGFLHTAFNETEKFGNPENMARMKLRLQLCMLWDLENVSPSKLDGKLESEGWEVRECLLTIEDV
jgi:hypothetical protein